MNNNYNLKDNPRTYQYLLLNLYLPRPRDIHFVRTRDIHLILAQA